MEKLCNLKSIITQNVDNLHQDAGSSTVIEFHGSLMTCYCRKCHKIYKSFDFLNEDVLPPHCKDEKCNGILKPSAGILYLYIKYYLVKVYHKMHIKKQLVKQRNVIYY